MKTYDVTLITAEIYETPTEVDWYIQQILDEDRLVQEALEKRHARHSQSLV